MRARDLRRRLTARLVTALATLLCLLFASSLRDVAAGLLPPPVIPAPMLPDAVGERDAALAALVVDEAGQPQPGASVRVFSIHARRAYFAGDRTADGAGRARFSALPRGEAWVLAYGAGRARASARVVLTEGEREERLVLRPARALDVVVVDETDHPVERAELELTTADPLPYVARTAADGTARLDRLGPPPYDLRARAEGFDEVVRTQLAPGTAPLRVRLERRGALDVTVVDALGEPAAGATVLVAGTGVWPARTAFTGAGGKVRVGGLRGGVFDLKARLGNQVSRTEIGIPLRRGEEKEARLVLGDGKRVLVTVTDGEGDGVPAVAGASVVLVEDGLSAFPLQGRTDEHGMVVLGPLAKDPAAVSARAPGFVPTGAVRVDAGDLEARVALRRGGAIVGEVLDDRGYPVGGATLEVVGSDPDGRPIDESSAMIAFRDESFELTLPGPAPLLPMGELGVMPGPIPDLPVEGALVVGPPRAPGDPWVTRSDGTFRAEPVPPGRVHVIVRHPHYVEVMTEALTVLPAGEARVHVVLHEGGWIEGRVLEADRTPVAGARVELAAAHGSVERVTYATDDGSFTFAAAPDEVLLSVSRPGAPADVVARLNVTVPDRDRKEVELVLPTVRETVALRVTDDRGYPVGRVEVHALALEAGVPLRRTLFTTDDGAAELPDAVGLALRLTLLRPGKAPLVETAERAPKALTLVLHEALHAKGTVTARDGRDRVAGAEVTLFTATGARHARTDAEGAYAFDDCAPGRVRLTVSHATHALGQKLARVAGDRDTPADLGAIDLAEAGEVTGEVVDSADQPVPGARVARDGVPTYLPMGPLPPGIAVADRQGRFTLGGLPEGLVQLEAYSADSGRGSVDGVEVRAGRTTDRVKITLPGGAEAAAREPRGAGSVAVTLGERAGAGGKEVVVVMVPPGSEAELSGLEPGDQLVTVNGQPARSIEGARRRLTGPLAEDVILELRRDDEPTGPEVLVARVRRERVRR